MNYLAHLLRSKGLGQLTSRALSIGQRYGVTPRKMMQAFDRLVRTLEQYGCRATLPVTAVAVARHPAPIRQLQERGIELAVHGWTHVNLEGVSSEQQREHLSRALRIMEQQGVSAVGFRSPYLRRSDTIRKAVEAAGFRYHSNQPILWDVNGKPGCPQEKRQAYQQAVDFYAPWSSAERPSLPTVHGQIVEIPVSLPDDEMLVERLGANSAQIAHIWSNVLHQTHHREELFTLQLHPERATICTSALSRVLSKARACDPPVWIARLDEIAEWWGQRHALRVDVTNGEHGRFDVIIKGPPDATVLVHDAQILGKSENWTEGYRLVRSHHFSIRCSSRPVAGVSERTDENLVALLKQLGYLYEISNEHTRYSVYVDRPNFAPEDSQALIQQIEDTRSPLIRVGRWPDGARSALAITGDIDALTLLDFGLRLVRK